MTPKSAAAIAALFAVVSSQAGLAQAQPRVTVAGGRVSIAATDATVLEILTLWAKAGGVTLVNTDRIPAERLTIQLDGADERQALDILLRAAGGYIATRRADDAAAKSMFERLAIMPPSAAIPVVARAAAPPPIPRPQAAVEAAYDTPRDRTPRDAAAEKASEAPADPGVIPGDADGVVFTTEQGATPAPSEAKQGTFESRRALETADPKDFKLPPGVLGAAPNASPQPVLLPVPGPTKPRGGGAGQPFTDR